MKSRKLKNLIKLSCRVAVYVPSTVDVNQATDNAEQVDGTLRLLSSLFGGATAADAMGCWLSDAGSLIKERITVVYAYCSSDQIKEAIEQVLSHAESIKQAMKQESVAIEVNGELYFV